MPPEDGQVDPHAVIYCTPPTEEGGYLLVYEDSEAIFGSSEARMQIGSSVEGVPKESKILDVSGMDFPVEIFPDFTGRTWLFYAVAVDPPDDTKAPFVFDGVSKAFISPALVQEQST